LATFKPNELGHIPVLMYHAFTTNPEYLDEWTRTPDGFRQDLQWLYDHDFSLVSMADLIDNEISVPPGKHPVVLTFDDSSSGQFRLLEEETGERYPDPTTAVGVMEAFFAEHPDFGRGGHFAVVPNNCFRYDEEVTTCEERLTWLAERGYEIGNHTWWHQNLGEADDDLFMSQIGDTKLWIDERVSGPANLSNVLTLPFGAFPATEWQSSMLLNGFDWQGQRIQMAAILTVGGGPSVSPDSSVWDPWAITRFNTDEGTLDYWKAQIETGAMTMYTSDGNPTSVTIPEELPEDLVDQFDPDSLARQGRSLLQYSSDPVDEQADLKLPAQGMATDRRSAFARRKQPPRARPFQRSLLPKGPSTFSNSERDLSDAGHAGDG
jgi:peptidoglycan/xylan/chitin deacetylase (PgdA/CDA1 family)